MPHGKSRFFFSESEQSEFLYEVEIAACMFRSSLLRSSVSRQPSIFNRPTAFLRRTMASANTPEFVRSIIYYYLDVMLMSFRTKFFTPLYQNGTRSSKISLTKKHGDNSLVSNLSRQRCVLPRSHNASTDSLAVYAIELDIAGYDGS